MLLPELKPLDLVLFLKNHKTVTATVVTTTKTASHSSGEANGYSNGYSNDHVGHGSTFAEVALREEVSAVTSCIGNRNVRLNEASLKLHELVAAGVLEESTVVRELTAAGLACGLDPSEIGPTIASGGRKGMSQPRDMSGVGTLIGTGVRIPDWDEILMRPPNGANGRTGLAIPVADHAAGHMDQADMAANMVVQPGMEDNPHRLARLYANSRFHAEGLILRYWQEDFHLWDGAAYRVIPAREVRAEVTGTIAAEFDRLHNIAMMLYGLAMARQNGQGGSTDDKAKPAKMPTALPVSTRLVGDVLQALQDIVLLRTSQCPKQPDWIGLSPTDKAKSWPVDEILPARNVLVHLPSIIDGEDGTRFPTPKFFSPYSLDYDFDHLAPIPNEWLNFLESVWPNDEESISTLQEWMGYLLTHDTSQQKILMLVGKTRSGKGTISKIITAMIGPENVASPTLSGLATNFGLMPLLGKLAAIVADARISGRTDTVAVIERLLSISGEDFQTIDRKHATQISTQLLVRFMILCNEPPKFKDASGAIIGRFVVLEMTQSFLGREDKGLLPRLKKELPGILLWSIEGWKRLRERGHFIQPSGSLDMLTSMKDMSSPIGVFVEEECDQGEVHQVSIPEIYNKWRTWNQSRGQEHVPDEQTFGRDLRTVVPGLKVRRLGGDGSRTRIYQGIKLKTLY